YLSKNPSFLRWHEHRRAQVIKEMLKLGRLLRDQPEQLTQLATTNRDIEQMFALSSRMQSAAGEPMNLISMLRGKEFFTQMYKSIDRVSDDIDPLLINALQTVEASPAAQARRRQQIQAVIFGGMVVTVLLAIYLTTLFSKGITGRLQVLTDNTGRLAKQLP